VKIANVMLSNTEIITFFNCDELCEHCEPYLMFDSNTSQQPAIVETGLEREYFTKHGMHLNSSGKECIAQRLAIVVKSFLKKKKDVSHQSVLER
jgi:lysophospholipase L1-like esterase